jgi:hypothetical protein
MLLKMSFEAVCLLSTQLKEEVTILYCPLVVQDSIDIVQAELDLKVILVDHEFQCCFQSTSLFKGQIQGFQIGRMSLDDIHVVQRNKQNDFGFSGSINMKLFKFTLNKNLYFAPQDT